MPFTRYFRKGYRKTYRKRKTFGKKRYFRRRYKKTSNVERKVRDFTASSLSVTNSGTFIGLASAVEQGTDEGQRVGCQIQVKSIQLRYTVDGKQGTPETDPFYNKVRLLVLVDKQPNQGTSTVANILEDPANPIVSPFEKDYFRRFRVIHDAVINLDYDDPTFCGKFYKKMRTVIRYPSGTGVKIPSVNNIIALAISDQADDYPVMNYYFRIRYTDA